jgi:hypothetical protein
MRFCSPSEYFQDSKRPIRWLSRLLASTWFRLLPWGLFPFSVSPCGAAVFLLHQSKLWFRRVAAYLHRDHPAPLGFLDPMTLSSAPCTCRPCFMPDPLLGLHPSKRFPPVQQFAVPDAVALLSLDAPALTFSLASSQKLPKQPSFFYLQSRPPETPPPSGLCSVRESATTNRRFRSDRARGSLGLFALQGFLPLWRSRTLTRLPLSSLLLLAASDLLEPPLRVFATKEIGHSSCEDRLPSCTSLPLDPASVCGLASARESPPHAPGFVTVPCRHSLNR